ncbi:MAG: CerR family C-terminal domain-containing protein [Gammaproteobacteria bacterium]|nr:CerR family C-terminal domain-containing protein [Gammaproteobacteria bacterium]
MPTSPTSVYNAAGDRTRQRLLEAAATCFAESGFAATSIRDITASAECNVAAVNYYFGGKQPLYHEVFAERLTELRDRRVDAMSRLIERDHVTLEEVLRAFADAFLEPLMNGNRGRITLALLMRDFLQSYLPQGMIWQVMVRPTLETLSGAIKKACPNLNDEEIQWCIQSLVAQLFHFLNMQKIARDNPGTVPAWTDLPSVVEHIIRFTKAGVLDYMEPRSA